MSQGFIAFAASHGVEIKRLDDSGNAAHQAKYRENNREKLRAAGAIYREKNRQAILEKKKAAYAENKYGAKEYAAENRDAILARKREYARANKALIVERSRAYYLKNKARIAAAKAAYNAQNPEIARKANRKRRALKAGSSGVLSLDIVEVLMSFQRGKCPNCRAKLALTGHHVDHITPLSRGGLNVDGNVQLLCPPCNLSKAAKDPIQWAQMNGRLL